MKFTQRTQVDLSRKELITVNMQQYDSARYIYFVVTDNGVPYDLTGFTLRIAGQKSDGKYVYNSATITNAKAGECEVNLTSQALAAKGVLGINLEFRKGGKILSTFPVNVVVNRTYRNDTVIESSNEFGALTDAINDLEDIDNHIWHMKNMGQDVREAMTGESVPMVGRDAVLTENIRDDQVTLPKLDPNTRSLIKSLELIEINSSEHTLVANGGSVISEEVSMDDGYFTFNISYDLESTRHPKTIVIEPPVSALIKELDYVRFEGVAEAPNMFGAIGANFNWGQMYKENFTKDNNIDVIVRASKVPSTYQGSRARIFIGIGSGTLIKGRFKISYIFKHERKTRSDHAVSATFATNAHNAELAKESITSITGINAGVRTLDEIASIVSDFTYEYDNIENIIKLVNKPSKSETYWAGYYIKVKYRTLEDLNTDLFMNYKTISGVESNKFMIMKNIGDWGPHNTVVELDITSMKENNPINLYEAINGTTAQSVFEELTDLYIFVGYAAKDQYTNTKQYPFEWHIRPMTYTKGAHVIATSLTNEFKSKMLEDNLEYYMHNKHQIPVGVDHVPFKSYLARDNSDDLITLTNIGNGWVKCKKDNDILGPKYAGVYIRVNYDSIEELDRDFTLEVNTLKGNHPRNCFILYEVSDWGSSQHQGVISISKYVNKEAFNLKQVITASPHDYKSKNHLYICMVDYNAGGINSRYEYDFKVTKGNNRLSADVVANKLSKDLYSELDERYITADSSGRYITCWGDSLTAGGGWTDYISKTLRVPVLNGGTGGEHSGTIMARQGGDVMTINNITIPAETDPVTIARKREDTGIPTAFGKKVAPLLQGGMHHVNPCYIGDIEGTLKWTGSSYSDPDGTWTFTRTKPGEIVQIKRPTAIRTNFDINKNNPRLMIIFIGQNGGWDSDLSVLVRQHRCMIDHSKCSDYLILGLSSGTASERKLYEQTMEKEFGRRFLSLRKYLSAYGLEDAGLVPDEQDRREMSEGRVPHNLLSDTVHYNTQCKEVIGKLIVKTIQELNIKL